MVAPFHYLPSLAGSDKENQPLNTGRGKGRGKQKAAHTHTLPSLSSYICCKGPF